MANMYEVGLEYIERGMGVFFVNYYKRPYKVEGDKVGGWQEGTTDKAELKRLWDIPNRKNTNIAITPAKSSLGFIIIDSDRHNEESDGVEELHALERKIGPLPDTIQALTPRKGEHRYYLTDADIRTQEGFIPGCDIIGKDYGFVVAPPSVTQYGEYTFEFGFDDVEMARLPKAWEEYILNNQPQTKGNISLKNMGDGEIIPHGQRYHYLVCKCAQLVNRIGDICTDEQIALLIMEFARTNIDQYPPFDMDDLEKKMLYTIGHYRKKDAESDAIIDAGYKAFQEEKNTKESGVYIDQWQKKIKNKQAWLQAKGREKSRKMQGLLNSIAQTKDT